MTAIDAEFRSFHAYYVAAATATLAHCMQILDGTRGASRRTVFERTELVVRPACDTVTPAEHNINTNTDHIARSTDQSA